MIYVLVSSLFLWIDGRPKQLFVKKWWTAAPTGSSLVFPAYYTDPLCTSCDSYTGFRDQAHDKAGLADCRFRQLPLYQERQRCKAGERQAAAENPANSRNFLSFLSSCTF